MLGRQIEVAFFDVAEKFVAHVAYNELVLLINDVHDEVLVVADVHAFRQRQYILNLDISLHHVLFHEAEPFSRQHQTPVFPLASGVALQDLGGEDDFLIQVQQPRQLRVVLEVLVVKVQWHSLKITVFKFQVFGICRRLNRCVR